MFVRRQETTSCATAALVAPDGTSAKLVTACGAWLDGPAPMTRNRSVRSRAPLISAAISLTLPGLTGTGTARSEEHTSELQSRLHLVCRLLLEKKNKERAIGHLAVAAS